MPIPDYRTFLLPVLKASTSSEVSTFGPVIQQVADDIGLTPEQRAELLPSGKQTVIRNRVAWAKFCLIKAGLLESVGWGQFRITDRGRSVLAQNLDRLDLKFLEQFPEWRQYMADTYGENASASASKIVETAEQAGQTPDETLRAAHQKIEDALANDLIERVLAAPPEFFERLTVRLLDSMGYGGSVAEAGKAIGRSGDNGIDGIVDQDALGLDRVYIQAKRYKPSNSVGSGEIRDFFGSLDRHKATKGLFVTTSTFSASAKETAEYLSKRIVLIDGRQLARLMIRFNVGCRVEETIHLKRIDEDFFE